MPGGNAAQKQRALAAAQNAARSKLGTLLTPEQREKWKDLTGAPFKGRLVPLPPAP